MSAKQGRRRSAARTASSSATCCARWIATRPCPTFRPDHPGRACARRSSCASCSARSAGARSRGRCRPRRSRPRCTRSVRRVGSRGEVRITVLGKSPSWQDVDGACSGYLVEEQGCRLLIDCGNGVFSKLRRFVDYVDVDAVVISHLHADHFLDLVPFSYALTYAPRQQPVPGRPLAGHRRARPARAARAAGRARLLPPRRRRVGQRGPDRERVRPARVRPRRRRSHVGPLDASRFQPVPHFVPDQRGRDRLDRERRRPLHLRRRLLAVRRAVRVRPRHRPAADRGDAAAARARRACAAT